MYWLTLQGNPVTGANLPTICGEAAGQHVYMDAGAYSSQEATMVATLTGNQSPKWRIKVISKDRFDLQ